MAALGPRWQPPEAVGQGKTARIEKPNDPSCCALHAVLHSNAGRLAYGFYHFRPAIRPVRPSPVTSSGAASAAAAVATPLGRGRCATCSESGVFAAEMAEAGVRFILTGHVVNNIHTCGPRQRGGWGRGRGARQPPHWAPCARPPCRLLFVFCIAGMPHRRFRHVLGIRRDACRRRGGLHLRRGRRPICRQLNAIALRPGVILGLNNINYAAALLHSQLYLLLLHILSIKLKQL